MASEFDLKSEIGFSESEFFALVGKWYLTLNLEKKFTEFSATKNGTVSKFCPGHVSLVNISVKFKIVLFENEFRVARSTENLHNWFQIQDQLNL